MEKNITGEKMLSHIDRIAGEKKPITADIFLTNYCNNRCPYCTYGRWELDTGAQAMRYEDFITYAKRLAVMGVQGFILTGEESRPSILILKRLQDGLPRTISSGE